MSSIKIKLLNGAEILVNNIEIYNIEKMSQIEVTINAYRITFMLYLHFNKLQLHTTGWYAETICILIFIDFPQNLWKFDEDI